MFLVSSQTSTIDPSCYTQRKDLWLVLLSTFLRTTWKSKRPDSHRNSKGGQMVSHLQQPIHVRLKLSWGGHAHLHRKQTRDKSIHHPFVTILSWQTLLSCDLVLHNLLNPTLPRQKHSYSPNRHHPSSSTNEEEEESKLSSIYEQNQARPIEQSEITGFKPHISSHPMIMIATGPGNSFFLTPPLSNLHAFSKLFWCCCFKPAIHGHENPAIPRAPRAPKGFHLKLCRPPNRALQAHPADSAGDPSSDTEATDDVSAPCNKLP